MRTRKRAKPCSAFLFQVRQSVKEAIMKALALILAAALCCGALAATDVSGNQSGLWDLANSPYNIVGDVTIPAGTSLNIDPGVQVLAMGDYRITALGRIYALGTEADSIRFLSGVAGPSPTWKGIRLESIDQTTHLGFCYIEKAEYGVNSINSPALIHHCRFNLNQKGMQLYGIGIADPAEVIVSTNIIENSIQNGILIAQNSNAVILANELRFNGTGTQYMAAIQLSNQSTGGSNNPEISSNWIHHNFKQGITAWDIVGAGAINPQIHDNIIEYNLTGIYLLNSSGYVFDNFIRHNFIAGDTNSGAGVMVAGATSQPYFERNEIHGNYTGFYIGTNAQPCLGDLAVNHAWAQGENEIYDNIDGQDILHSVYTYSYTNPNIVIKAENNFWGTDNPLEIAVGINDHNDDPALPTVDFDPIMVESQDVDVTGTIQYYGTFLLIAPRLQFVDAASGEILYEYESALGQQFTYTLPLTEPFYVVAQATEPYTGRSFYGTAGSLQWPIVINPGVVNPIDLGNILIEEALPPRHQVVGAPETIGAHTVYPVYNRLFVYHWEYINWLYTEGDYAYIKRHERYNDIANVIFNFPDGTPWDKIANVQPNDTWSRVEILDDNGTQRVSSFHCKAVTDDAPVRDFYFLIFQRDSVDNSLIAIRMLDSIRRLYHYEEGFVERAEDISTNVETVYLQEGNFWDFTPILPVYQPTYLALDFYEHYQGNQNHLTLFWQAPTDDGIFNWTSYRIYNADQLFAEVPFGQNYWHTETLPAAYYLFTVCAYDGTNVSAPTNSVILEVTANDDPAAIPPALSIQPNPASLAASGGADIRISSAKSLHGEIAIYNLRGQLVQSVPLDSPGDFSYRWDLRDKQGMPCSAGLYLVRIKLADGTELNAKLALLK